MTPRWENVGIMCVWGNRKQLLSEAKEQKHSEMNLDHNSGSVLSKAGTREVSDAGNRFVVCQKLERLTGRGKSFSWERQRIEKNERGKQ